MNRFVSQTLQSFIVQLDMFQVFEFVDIWISDKVSERFRLQAKVPFSCDLLYRELQTYGT